MKYIYLSAVGLLFVGTAFAQGPPGTNPYNESVIEAKGGNTGTITQTIGVGVANYSDLYQSNHTNTVAYRNNAVVNQEGGNNSFVWQQGREHEVTVNQIGGAAGMRQISDVKQLGSQNNANVLQIGLANESDIDQVLWGAVDYINEAIVVQGMRGPGPSSENKSVIDQRSDGNKSTHLQDGVGNSATAVQASSVMTVPVIGVVLQTVLTDQEGDRNFANVNQTGDNNYSTIEQDAGFGGGVGMGLFTNEATVMQSGDLNTAIITQGDMGAPNADNTLTLTQTNLVGGNGNTFGMTQSGSSTLTATQINN